MVRRLYPLRAVHGQDSISRPIEQSNAVADDGAQGAVQLEDDQEGQVW